MTYFEKVTEKFKSIIVDYYMQAAQDSVASEAKKYYNYLGEDLYRVSTYVHLDQLVKDIFDGEWENLGFEEGDFESFVMRVLRAV
jgi:hypothetical protein